MKRVFRRLTAVIGAGVIALSGLSALALGEGAATGGLDFDASNGTDARLLYGTMFYIDWKPANGLTDQHGDLPGRDCSGDAANGANPDMALCLTVSFEAVDGVSDPATCWREIKLRLRSSQVNGEERASEFAVIPRPTGGAARMEIAVPLSTFDTRMIDWRDVKELIIQVPVEAAYQLGETGNSDKIRLTVEGARIVDFANLAGRARLKERLEQTENYRYADDEAGAAFEQVRQEARELLRGYAADDAYSAMADRLDAAIQALHDLRDMAERAVPLTGPAEPEEPLDGRVTLELTGEGDLAYHAPDALYLQWEGRGTLTGAAATVHTPAGDIPVTGDLESAAQDGVGRYRMALPPVEKVTGVTLTLIADAPFTLTDAFIGDGSSCADAAARLTVLLGEDPLLDDEGDTLVAEYDAAIEQAAALAQTPLVTAGELTAVADRIAALRHARREISRGDVDDDMRITAADALMALQAATGKILLTDEESVMANVDRTDGVSAADALQILQFATGKIGGFARPEKESVPADKFADAAAPDGQYQVLIGAPAADEEAAGFEGEGGYLAFRGVNFGQGNLRAFMAIAAVPDELAGQTLAARLDSPAGDPVAALTLTATGGEAIFAEQYAPLTAAVTGVHDLYLTAPKGVRLDGFVFSSYTGEETDEERAERMGWWNDARFGMFIHWGAYANYPFTPDWHNGYTEWVMSNDKVSRADYEQRAVATFNPQSFDADAIVKLAKDAGQKYIVFTSKHHEGFSMFNTHVDGFKDYSLTGYGVYQGADVLAQLADASRAAGIPFGCYYSIMDWRHPAAAENWGGMLDKARYLSDMKAQLRELIQFYDLDILWFDGEWVNWWSTADGRALYRYLRTLKPSLIINNRVGKRAEDDGDFGTPEQTIPAGGLGYDWESCITMNNNWGYAPYDQNWKSPEWIVRSVVDTASKGGNILLNVGPDSQGVVPADCATNMRAAGQWFAVCGESIYGTTASPFTDALSFGAATKKEGTLYLHVLNRPASGKITFPALKNELLGADVMGSGLRLNVEQSGDTWSITLPATAVVQYDTVIRVEVEGMPAPAKTLTYSENYALNKPTSVSNYYQNNSQYDGHAAVDGDSGTRWATDDDVTDCWLEVDLQADTTFNAAILSDYQDRTTSYAVEYWDGSDWQTAYTGEAIGARAAVQFPAVTARKVRLHILTIRPGNGPSIWEFGVYTAS
ncbi:MAG: alpha-L-fucosidase [Acutalibacteraceae bacterium]|jgi:alpha-L-fucosidase